MGRRAASRASPAGRSATSTARRRRADRASRRAALYDKLERVILPLFYGDRERFVDVMRHAIALNGSFFNTQRMIDQYARKAYLP